jgi:hypothetical protein
VADAVVVVQLERLQAAVVAQAQRAAQRRHPARVRHTERSQREDRGRSGVTMAPWRFRLVCVPYSPRLPSHPSVDTHPLTV